MKYLKVSLLLFFLISCWGAARVITNNHLNNLVQSGEITYGPLPDHSPNYYSFNGLHAAFDSSINLRRVDEFTKNEFESLILDSLKPETRESFQEYLRSTLTISEDYQMDPFWVISIMMAESGFINKALSSKNAMGLMQIRPDTAEHLYSLMGKKFTEVELNNNLNRPDENIEIGIFYLKKLLQNFRLNYNLATIAYNLGPNKLKEQLQLNKLDSSQNAYLIRIQQNYSNLTKHYLIELKNRPHPFEKTFVVIDQGRKFEQSVFKLYISLLLDEEFKLTSENLPFSLFKS